MKYETIESLLSKSTLMPNGCIEWNRALKDDGYGITQHGGKLFRVHRLMFELCYGEQPCSVVVMHKCDNRKCINRYHLSVGSQSDNIADCYRKGRFGTKLKWGDAITIRNSELSYIALSKLFGVTPQHIGHIKGSKRWNESSI